jgi:hypothetical protein
MKTLIAGAAVLAAVALPGIAFAEGGCMSRPSSAQTAQTATDATPVQTAQAPTGAVAR